MLYKSNLQCFCGTQQRDLGNATLILKKHISFWITFPFMHNNDLMSVNNRKMCGLDFLKVIRRKGRIYPESKLGLAQW